MTDAPRTIWVQHDTRKQIADMMEMGVTPHPDVITSFACYHHDDVVRELRALVAYLAGQNDDHVRVALAGNPDVCDEVWQRAEAVLAKMASD